MFQGTETMEREEVGRFYSVQFIASDLELSESTIIRMCRHKEIDGARKIRGQWRIPKAAYRQQLKTSELTGKF